MTNQDAMPARQRGKNMDWVVQFEGQMLVCALLAKALYGMPDKDWLNGIIAKRTFDAIPFGSLLAEVAAARSTLVEWTDSVPDGLDDNMFATIRDDHTRLFVGPGKLPSAPWESVYVNKDRAVFQRETISVKNWYARFEMVLASDYNEPADHIGLEFGFLAHLSDLTLAASAIRDGEQVKRLIDAQRGFLAQHMLPWIPRWANDVVNHARTELYRGLGWLARGTVLESASFFGISNDKSDSRQK